MTSLPSSANQFHCVGNRGSLYVYTHCSNVLTTEMSCDTQQLCIVHPFHHRLRITDSQQRPFITTTRREPERMYKTQTAKHNKTGSKEIRRKYYEWNGKCFICSTKLWIRSVPRYREPCNNTEHSKNKRTFFRQASDNYRLKWKFTAYDRLSTSSEFRNGLTTLHQRQTFSSSFIRQR